MSAAFNRWRQIVAGITYKPNVVLRLSRQMHGPYDEDILLEVVQRVPDAEHRGAPPAPIIDVIFAERVPPLEEASDIIAFIAHCVQRSELHEIDEWLKVHGVRVREPHW